MHDTYDENKSSDELNRMSVEAFGFSTVVFKVAEPLVAAIRGPFVVPENANLVIEFKNGYLTIKLEIVDRGETK